MSLNKKGKVYLVGAGPGDPDLLTRKAERLIRQADIILYDRLVNPFILQLAKPGIKVINVGKQPYHKHIQQAEINRQLIDAASSHGCVVRLKGGDPAIFGRVREEVVALKAQNIDCEIVPGITSASAAVAIMVQGLTGLKIATNVTYTTGHFCKENHKKVDISAILKNGTLAIYMGIKNLNEMMTQIYQKTEIDYPVVVVYNISTYQEKVIKGTVTTIGQIIKRQAGSPGLVLVGSLMSEIDCENYFKQKATKNYLITGGYQLAIDKALSLYSEGHFCIINQEDRSMYHETQLELINEITEKYTFDEYIELIE